MVRCLSIYLRKCILCATKAQAPLAMITLSSLKKEWNNTFELITSYGWLHTIVLK